MVKSKLVGKLRMKEFSEKLFTSQTIQSRKIMLLDWAIHTSLIQKRHSHSYQSKHHMCFYDFFVTQDYYSFVGVIVDLVSQY